MAASGSLMKGSDTADRMSSCTKRERPVFWADGKLHLVNQPALPEKFEIVTMDTVAEIAAAITAMTVRGAPAIGAAGAYGMFCGARESSAADAVALVKDLTVVKQQLDASRPTAVNLSWATKILLDIAQVLQENDASVDFIRWKILEEAHVLCEEDVAANRAMGELGAQLVAPGANILHHCNTGALATVDVGTALGVIYTCHAQGKGIHVWVDETRPRLQGSRLTAWELQQGGVPLHLIADNAAGHLMQNGKVDIILYGADRVAANGDTANKIGTYKISVVGRENGIPVYPVVPTSTIDLTVPTGKDIPIEERGEEEVSTVFGTRIAPEGVPVFNPAFDVTPAKYISGIITEEGIAYPPFTLSLPKMVRAAEARRQEKWAAKLFAIKAELAELAGAQQ